MKYILVKLELAGVKYCVLAEEFKRKSPCTVLLDKPTCELLLKGWAGCWTSPYIPEEEIVNRFTNFLNNSQIRLESELISFVEAGFEIVRHAPLSAINCDFAESFDECFEFHDFLDEVCDDIAANTGITENH